jgi:hypothetical protein
LGSFGQNEKHLFVGDPKAGRLDGVIFKAACRRRD